MPGKTIDATLRLASDFAKTLADLKALRAEAAATKRDLAQPVAVPAPRPTTTPTPTPAATPAAPKVSAEEKALTAARAQETQERLKAERAAAAEAQAIQQAALRAQAEAERRAARERRLAEADERLAKRKAARLAEREAAAAEKAKVKAEKEARRTATLLAPQITDVVTGLASGQSPGIVALQQGGQLRDVFGSFSNAGRALLGTITLTRVAVGGLVGGLALVVTQLVAGHRESEQLRRSLALTGNAGGTSLGLISTQAKSIAAEMAVGIGTVREALAALLTVSGQTAGTMQSTGRAVAAITKLTGQSADEAVKAFENQADGVTDWAVKANRAYNFLTEEQVNYIRRLESQGRTQEAIRFTNDQLADSLKQRTATALGTLERGWNAVTRAMSGFLDKLKEIGRDETAEDRLTKLQAKLDEIRARQAQPLFAGRRKSTDAAEVARIQEEQKALLRGQVRSAERAISLQAQQDAILQHSKEMQASVTAVSLAEAQKRLAGQQATLDKQQAAVELADAQGLLSERAKALELNRIDQDRLRAQAELQRQQLALARAAVDLEAKPQDRRAAEARAIEAQTQLVSTQSRLASAVSESRRIVEADTLATSRERAQAWADIWLRADQQVRDLARENRLSDSATGSDPAARAQAAAQARVQDLRRQIEETTRDLQLQISLSIDPEARAELRQQLGALLIEGSRAVDEAARRASQDSVNQQLAEQLEALRLAEQGLTQEVERGALTTEEAERRKFAAREAALPQIKEMLALLQTLAVTDADKNAIAELLLQIDRLSDKTTEFQALARSSAQSNLAQAFLDIETGAQRADQAVGSFVANYARSMLELLNKRIAEKLVGAAFKALEAFAQQNQGGGGFYGVLAQIAGALVTTKHSGGLIDGAVTAGRTVAPWVFSAAQVLHSGGIAGLAPDEQPAILRKGEEVLTEDNPRHVRNFRGGGAALFGDFNVAISLGGGNAGAGDQAQAQSLARGLKAAVQQYLLDEMRPGGLLQNVTRS
jgi:hypothetical protein